MREFTVGLETTLPGMMLYLHLENTTHSSVKEEERGNGKGKEFQANELIFIR